MGPHYGSPIQALRIKPYWSSGKLLSSSACPMIEDDNFYFIFQENWHIYP
jgi:hypothetical protein